MNKYFKKKSAQILSFAVFFLLSLMMHPSSNFSVQSAEACELTWPSEHTGISSVFGPRVPPVPGASAVHRAVDILAPAGSPVFAAHSGVVSQVSFSSCGGNIIWILDEANGIQSRFIHMQEIWVSEGQSVSQGDTIGLSGGTAGGADTCTSGAHLDYRLEINNGSGFTAVDPASAQGQNLCDPAVRAQLIQQAHEILGGSASGASSPGGNLGPPPTGVGNPSGGGTFGPSTGGASGSAPSCNSEILSTGRQLAESQMNIEKQMIDEALARPQSVMELSCFDQFGEMFNQEIGAIFGNTHDDDIPEHGLMGIAPTDFRDIFVDTQGQIGQEISDALNDGLFGSRGGSIGSSISSLVGGAISDVMEAIGLGGDEDGANVEFQCEAMNLLWDIMQCEGILDFDIPSLDEFLNDPLGIGGILDGLRPESCSGQALYDAAIGAADRVFTSHGENLPEGLRPSNLESALTSY